MNPLVPLYRLADSLRYRKHGNLGQRGEDLAHRWLRRNGFTVVARNWRPPQGGGEIDIIAWEGECLVFVEVKSRASGRWSAPERALDDEKMRTLRRAARDYLRRAGGTVSHVRFDGVTVTGGEIEYFRDAFAISLSL